MFDSAPDQSLAAPNIDNNPDSISVWVALFENIITENQADAAHDICHLRRVWKNSISLSKPHKGVDMLSLLAMSYLHDIVAHPKNSPMRSKSSTHSSNKAKKILEHLGFDSPRIDLVCHGIASHSFSAGIDAKAIEAMILSDADKLDALGEVGIARLFYTAGQIGSEFHDLHEPVPVARKVDGHRYLYDHYFEKIVLLPSLMHTPLGRQIALKRLDTIKQFLSEILRESIPGSEKEFFQLSKKYETGERRVAIPQRPV